MEIFFLIDSEGNASAVPAPSNQDHDEVVDGIRQQAAESDILAIIQIVQMVQDCDDGEQRDAVVVTAEMKNGPCCCCVNVVEEDDDRVVLSEPVEQLIPAEDHESFF
ncbi:MAG: hypothetical protein EOL87_01610 [Spartobacteria bacterium]|nr:hypothetical protein [Spartobacteria bacterium]